MPQALAEELKSIPMSPNLGQSLERAHRFAREQAHRAVTLEHLLLALAEDPEAALILESANVELARLTTEVSGYLGRLLEDMRAEAGSEPRPDAELLRVLQAAASAAQQSRRRQIDGAIVLAAIVGDGKSPAAALLKALGMTFEEAIRALQRANTKARLSAQKAAPPAAEVEAPAVAGEPPAPRSAMSQPPVSQPAEPQPPVSQPAESQPPVVAQTAEEILAAARARIQLRSAAAARPEGADSRGRASPSEAPATPPAPDAKAPGAKAPSAAAATQSLSNAIEAVMTAPPAQRFEGKRPPASPQAASPPADAGQGTPAPVRPTWAPPPEPRPPAGMRPSQPASARTPIPFPAKPLQPGEGPPRPPLPPRSGAAAPTPSGLPDRSARAPWPEGAERGPSLHAGPPAGVLPHPQRPLSGGPAAQRPLQPPWTSQPRPGGAGERGPLVESIPRRMRKGRRVTGEVRIARDKIEALMQVLTGGMPHRPGAHLARALSVRLRAPNGGFTIETVTPETQWIDGTANLVHDEAAQWRWNIVPRRRGRARLLLTVSARTIGADALMAESAPPDRVIDVRVGANHARLSLRLTAWLAALTGAALLGRFGEEAWTAALATIQRALGG
jgi:hypothetical protein